jgi:hypothetical protein
MIHRIHILGASGSGTTTLGRALAERLQCLHFDTDDYFWLPTDPPYTQRRERSERAQLLMDDVTAHDAWVVSGSLCRWGDVAMPLFELVVFLWVPHAVRMDRLHRREHTRFGERILPGGICMSSPKRFWRGQRHMMREVWTFAADGYMKSGLERSRAPFSALKRSTPLRSTSLCSW